MDTAVEALGWAVMVVAAVWLLKDRVQAVKRRSQGTNRAYAWSHNDGGSTLPDWAHAGIAVVSMVVGGFLIGLGQRM